jgi:hypothetical protein
MSCSHDPLDLMRFAEGNALASELTRIQEQLRQCSHCQKALAGLLDTAATLKQLRQPALPAVEVERWVHHLRRVRKQQAARLPAIAWARRLRPAPIVALLTLVLLFFSYNTFLQRPPAKPNGQEDMRLFLQEHAIAQDQGAFTTETISELLITENSRGARR